MASHHSIDRAGGVKDGINEDDGEGLQEHDPAEGMPVLLLHVNVCADRKQANGECAQRCWHCRCPIHCLLWAQQMTSETLTYNSIPSPAAS